MKTNIHRHQAEPSRALSELDLHPVIARVYANRGIQAPEELETELAQLLSYHRLSQIDEAAFHLAEAITQQYRIVVVGDYDVDGATSTALMVSVLKKFGAASVDYLVPNRFENGYGLSPAIVDLAAVHQPDMIITVDNGISSVEGVSYANKKGIKVIITDHHLAPDGPLPQAASIVNPNQLGDEFPSKNLAGVGVAFYVLLALRAKLREINWFEMQGIAETNLANYLDLVALGTVADIVPLDRNNRILVQQGLRRISKGHCCAGIKALLAVANRPLTGIAASDLSFAIGPRLNAAGRLEDMALGVECLLTKDFLRSKQIASRLELLNQERKSLEEKMRSSAFEALNKIQMDDDQHLPMGLCLMNQDWHEGIVGLLASRIKDRVHRPVIVFAPSDDGFLKGSGRSIQGLHIRDVLNDMAIKHPELIVRFGGHAMAAGLTISQNQYEQFAELFDHEVKGRLNEDHLQQTLMSDGELQDLDFCLELAESLRDAGPWGQGFPEPLFDGRFRIVEQRLVGGAHLKMVLALGGQLMDAIAFRINTDEWPNDRCEMIHAAYRLDVNEFRGVRKVQLMIEHFEQA